MDGKRRIVLVQRAVGIHRNQHFDGVQGRLVLSRVVRFGCLGGGVSTRLHIDQRQNVGLGLIGHHWHSQRWIITWLTQKNGYVFYMTESEIIWLSFGFDWKTSDAWIKYLLSLVHQMNSFGDTFLEIKFIWFIMLQSMTFWSVTLTFKLLLLRRWIHEVLNQILDQDMTKR